jgi:hypothetical protein
MFVCSYSYSVRFVRCRSAFMRTIRSFVSQLQVSAPANFSRNTDVVLALLKQAGTCVRPASAQFVCCLRCVVVVVTFRRASLFV